MQVEKFYFPVDLYILKTEPTPCPLSTIPIILSCPFLMTSDVLINCRNEVIKHLFGNITMEFNIFIAGFPLRMKYKNWIR